MVPQDRKLSMSAVLFWFHFFFGGDRPADSRSGIPSRGSADGHTSPKRSQGLRSSRAMDSMKFASGRVELVGAGASEVNRPGI
jgi:hypothetical protein